MSSTKSSIARQKACVVAALASFNNGHSSNSRNCCVGVRSLSRPNLVPTRPLHLRNVTWRSSLVANLSSTALGCALAANVEARVVVGHCHMVMTTLARSLIWPSNSYVFNCCTSCFSVSPSFQKVKKVAKRL
jgi:hypothetical protein